MTDYMNGVGALYALTWHSPEGRPYYWSVRQGWTRNIDVALHLSQDDIDSIEEDDRLQNLLPAGKNCRDGADWELSHALRVTD